MLNHIFVYGTLRKTVQGNLHPYLKNHAAFIGLASLPGRLFLVANYPGAIPSPNHSDHRICGELYRLLRPRQTLRLLDEYEECSERFPKPHEYQRRAETVKLDDGKTMMAWVYWYQYPTVGLKQLTSGDFFVKRSN